MEQSRYLRAIENAPPNALPNAPPIGPADAAATIDSTELMNGQRELHIRHGESVYRLRVTAAEKLILTK